MSFPTGTQTELLYAMPASAPAVTALFTAGGNVTLTGFTLSLPE